MKPRIPARILVLLLLNGCHSTRDQTLSLKPAAGTIKVTIKVPEELVATDMQVTYRSTKCTWTYRSMLDWEKRTRDSYTTRSIRPLLNPRTGLHEASLAVNGGGKCHWRLSAVLLGVEPEDPSKFGDDVAFGWGGSIVVMFDETDSAHGGPNFAPTISTDGTVSIKQDYYPWLGERFLAGHRKTISLMRKGYDPIRLRALGARLVHFEPNFHSGYLVRSVGPKVKQIGVGAVFYYPDGSQSMESRGQPSLQKLDAIRQGAEARR